MNEKKADLCCGATVFSDSEDAMSVLFQLPGTFLSYLTLFLPEMVSSMRKVVRIQEQPLIRLKRKTMLIDILAI